MVVGDPTRVCVLEGLYRQLASLGSSHSIAMELQTRGLQPDSAIWTMSHSTSGFQYPSSGQVTKIRAVIVRSIHPSHPDAEDSIEGRDLGPLVLLSAPVSDAGLLPQL